MMDMRHSKRSCMEIKLRIIVHLSEYHNVGVYDLFEFMRTDRHTFRAAIESLTRHQLIIIEPRLPDNGRHKNMITLTEKGRIIYPQAKTMLSLS